MPDTLEVLKLYIAGIKEGLDPEAVERGEVKYNKAVEDLFLFGAVTIDTSDPDIVAYTKFCLEVKAIS